jgi:hypothetical protein
VRPVRRHNAIERDELDHPKLAPAASSW